MQKKILMGLFICSFISFTISNGLTPLLPVYTTSIGAKPAMTGYYLSLSCLMLAFGLLIGGWLADRYQRRKALLIVSGILFNRLLYKLKISREDRLPIDLGRDIILLTFAHNFTSDLRVPIPSGSVFNLLLFIQILLSDAKFDIASGSLFN